MKTNKRFLAAFEIFGAGVMWSFAGVLGKSVGWNALSLVGVRALVAIAILGGYRRSFRVSASPANWVGALGVLLTSLLFITANKLTSAANAIVLQYAMPALVILANWLFYRQRPSRRDVVMAALVLLGVVLCFVEGLGGGSALGDGLAILSAATFAMVFFAARMSGGDAMTYSYQGNLLACLCLLYIPFDANFTLAPAQLVPALVMGVCLGLGYLFFSMGIRSGVAPLAAALIANVEPVLNPTWVFLFLGENPGLWSIVGALIVLTAVTVYSLTGQPSQKGENDV